MYIILTQSIYEIANGIGGFTQPFNIFTIRPRKHITINSQINEILTVPQTVLVEENKGASDPVQFLAQGDPSQPDRESIVCEQ